MSAPLAFVDLESTGLDPDRHEVWELAIIRREPDGSPDDEHVWQFRPNLATAEPGALRINRFYERFLPSEAVNPHDVAFYVAQLLNGAHMVGAVPSFDAAFLERWLRLHGQAPAWHYHLIDIEALAVGYLRGWLDADDERLALAAPPWKSHGLSAALGIYPGESDEHTALGDARWARAVYDRVMGTPTVR